VSGNGSAIQVALRERPAQCDPDHEAASLGISQDRFPDGGGQFDHTDVNEPVVVAAKDISDPQFSELPDEGERMGLQVLTP
jgi:hypothetical protein